MNYVFKLSNPYWPIVIFLSLCLHSFSNAQVFYLGDDLFNKKLAEAQNHELKTEYDDAIKIYEELLSQEPFHRNTLLQMGNLLERLDYNDNALYYFNLLTTYHPNFGEGHFALGTLRMKLGQFEAALKDLENAQALNNENETNMVVWKGFYNPDDQSTKMLKVDTQKTWNSTITHQKAICYTKLNRFPEAIENYNQLIKAEPDVTSFLIERAELFYLEKQNESALNDVQTVLALEPENVKAAALFWEWSGKNGDEELNHEILNHLLELSPENTDLILKRALANYKKGKYHEAIFDYTLALELREESAAIYFDRALCYEKVEDWEKAQSDFQTAIEKSPDNPDFLAAFGVFWLRQKNYKKALEFFGYAIDFESDNPNHYFNSGVAYQGLKDNANACQAFSKAGKLGYERGTEAAEKICKD